MNVFKELGKDLNYKDILQVDGAFSACHINYGKSLKFNGADSKNMAQNSRKNSLTENGHIDDLEAVQYDFNGTEKDFKKQDIILLWEKYWLEYINAFNKLVAELPDSIVTVYVGRHAIELGFKYLMTKKNIKIEIFKADVSKREEASKLVDYAIEKYKKIDVLINNAGISLTGLFTDVTDEEWNKIINNDLYSVFCTTQEVLTNMIMRKEGCIINISSIWGIVGSSCESIYSVAKAGVDGMTKSLAKELGPSNIRVNSIAPGIIDTEMNNCYSAEEIEAIKEEIPLGRIGKKSDISKCIEWLIEDEYTTGQIISINGGWVIR